MATGNIGGQRNSAPCFVGSDLNILENQARRKKPPYGMFVKRITHWKRPRGYSEHGSAPESAAECAPTGLSFLSPAMLHTIGVIA